VAGIFAVDTAQALPLDLIEPARQVRLSTRSYRVTARSVVVLKARASSRSGGASSGNVSMVSGRPRDRFWNRLR
jgi:hypothetical protein